MSTPDVINPAVVVRSDLSYDRWNSAPVAKRPPGGVLRGKEFVCWDDTLINRFIAMIYERILRVLKRDTTTVTNFKARNDIHLRDTSVVQYVAVVAQKCNIAASQDAINGAVATAVTAAVTRREGELAIAHQAALLQQQTTLTAAHQQELAQLRTANQQAITNAQQAIINEKGAEIIQLRQELQQKDASHQRVLEEAVERKVQETKDSLDTQYRAISQIQTTRLNFDKETALKQKDQVITGLEEVLATQEKRMTSLEGQVQRFDNELQTARQALQRKEEELTRFQTDTGLTLQSKDETIAKQQEQIAELQSKEYINKIKRLPPNSPSKAAVAKHLFSFMTPISAAYAWKLSAPAVLPALSSEEQNLADEGQILLNSPAKRIVARNLAKEFEELIEDAKDPA